MGKAYANKKKLEDKPKNDFYPTPKGLVYELLDTKELNGYKNILEPACGEYAISDVLKEKGYNVTSRDLQYGQDFLKDSYENESYDAIVTNPPFNLWNEFVEKAKSINCKKIIFIGRTNYFGSHSRNIKGIWNELSDVYVFDRQIAYDGPFREDGKAKAGCLITGWFVCSKDYNDFPKIHIIDIDKWIVKNQKKLIRTK